CERPLLAEDLKKIKIGPSPAYKTRIGTTLAKEEEIHLMNKDVFAWSSADMPGIDLEFMCHRLSVSSGSWLVAQRRRKLGEEEQKAARKETSKLLTTGFIEEV
ncbi:hypothetical protein CR513_22935, partial [Mucuna pruriens]